MNPKICHFCQHAIAPYAPLSGRLAKWHCTVYQVGKWEDETCNQFTPRMKTKPLPKKSNNPQEPIDDRKQLIECLEAVLMVIALECRPSDAGKDVVKQAKEVLSKAKGQL